MKLLLTLGASLFLLWCITACIEECFSLGCAFSGSEWLLCRSLLAMTPGDHDATVQNESAMVTPLDGSLNCSEASVDELMKL